MFFICQKRGNKLNNDDRRISIQPLMIAYSLQAVAFLLITINIVEQFAKYKLNYHHDRLLALFDLSLEMNIPTFYTVLLLLFASLLLLLITLLQARQRNKYVTKWAVLSLGFLYMAYDDGFQVHEDLVGVIRPHLWDGNLGPFYYAWVIPALVLVIILSLFFRKFIRHLPSVTKKTFLLAAACYLGGCVGFEMIGGYYHESHGGFNSLTYNLISSVEEGMEMTGVILFIYALLEYLATGWEKISIQFASALPKQ